METSVMNELKNLIKEMSGYGLSYIDFNGALPTINGKKIRTIGLVDGSTRKLNVLDASTYEDKIVDCSNVDETELLELIALAESEMLVYSV